MSLIATVQLFAEQVKAPDTIFKVDLTDTTVQNIFNVVLALAGALAVVFIVFGGIKYMLSQGDQNRVKQAKDTILYAAIGIVIVIVSFMLVNFVIGKF